MMFFSDAFLRTLSHPSSSPVWATLFRENHLYTGHDDGSLCVWDVSTGTCITPARRVHDGRIRTILIVEDKLITASDDESVRVHSLESLEKLHVIRFGDWAMSIVVDESVSPSFGSCFTFFSAGFFPCLLGVSMWLFEMRVYNRLTSNPRR